MFFYTNVLHFSIRKLILITVDNNNVTNNNYNANITNKYL